MMKGIMMASDKFDNFLEHRQMLLFKYKKGDLSKREFIDEIFYFIDRLGLKPFRIIDNVKKAVYNYHYYNAMAKYYNQCSKDRRISNNERKSLIDISYDYYKSKDRVTQRLLEVSEFRDLEAYFVKTKSETLNDKLYEIVIKNNQVLFEINYLNSCEIIECEFLVLHSTSPFLLSKLREENVFIEKKKTSLTDSYINQKY